MYFSPLKRAYLLWLSASQQFVRKTGHTVAHHNFSNESCTRSFCSFFPSSKSEWATPSSNPSSLRPGAFLDAAKYIIPHPCKKKRNGDDAAFCTSWHLAVADGVGGWELSGIDASLYSRELLSRIESLLEKEENGALSFSPVTVLQRAYMSTKAIGSTTCCLVFLDGKNMKISTANLGDSGFILYRSEVDKVISRSEFQSHDFNFPLQLGTGSSDLPEHAEQLTISVHPNDWIVVGTDGLWDNLYEAQIVEILKKSNDSKVASQVIAQTAFSYSQDPMWKSPFVEREMHYTGEIDSLGGKPDDIAVVVAQIR
ncbi:putative protein phosphatase 2C [Cardiosporidium cionae]|uniref:Protein phosphatase n=1 Tax=Cardiosporidium cionae TaxID=476202 RepID=A0ABQ7J4U5_9APIC|nr:putative protein phosphatase 2C [Cardiosporidium cionae]|eukprot:KAF8819019.1 putative protein phosphatase 2C [Cardiosporidium cionae]